MRYYFLYYLKRGSFQTWIKKRPTTSTLIFTLLIFSALNIALSKYLQSCPPPTISIKYLESQLRSPTLASDQSEGENSSDVIFRKEAASSKSSIFNMNVNLGRWDDRRLYRIFDNVYVGQHFIHLSTRYNITLATQSSMDRIDSLSEVVQHWGGPISLALYLPDDDEFSLLQGFIIFLQRCHENITNKLSLHILIPKSLQLNPISSSPHSYNTDDYPCIVQPDRLLKDLLRKQHRSRYLHQRARANWKTSTPFPQNHLRNLARKNCQTHYNYLTDIDIIPSFGILDQLDQFFKKKGQDKCGKCVYVVPTFELDHRVKYPKSKKDLLRLCKKKLAQPFHHRIFIYNQYATNFSRWEKSGNDETIHVSHTVANFEFLYEPFYVSTDTVPPHDERFIGYGYTRNSQVYEMFIAGYTFKVLTPVFNCHWGLLTKKQRLPGREVQNTNNRLLMNDFKREIFAKYKYTPPGSLVSSTPPGSTTLAYSNAHRRSLHP